MNMKTYVILESGYFGGIEEVPDGTKGIRPGTTRTEVPYIPDGYYAVWLGTGWGLTDNPPPYSSLLNQDLAEINRFTAEIADK